MLVNKLVSITYYYLLTTYLLTVNNHTVGVGLLFFLPMPKNLHGSRRQEARRSNRSSGSSMGEGEAGAGWWSSSMPSLPLVAALSAWVSLNVFINFWNKWALSPEGAAFAFPIFYSSCHMAMGLLSSSLIMAAVPSVRNLSPTQMRQHGGKLLLLSTLTVANIVCSNASLMYIGLSVNQIIKSVGPLPALVLTYFVHRRRYSATICVSVFLMVAGAILAVPQEGDTAATQRSSMNKKFCSACYSPCDRSPLKRPLSCSGRLPGPSRRGLAACVSPSRGSAVAWVCSDACPKSPIFAAFGPLVTACCSPRSRALPRPPSRCSRFCS